MRVPQPRGTKGSLKWIQGVAEDSSHPVNQGIRENWGLADKVKIDWKSPLAEDDFAEYRDSTFLRVLGLDELAGELSEFWPTHGPQWDALARIGDKRVLLVEAKAHVAEMNSTCAAGTKSRLRIEDAMDRAKSFYGATAGSNWLSGYYQYANRLAHVQFLRDHGVDAHLMGVYFLGDSEMRGPAEISTWVKAIDDCHDSLGLRVDQHWPFIHQLFVRVPTAPGVQS
jgi:hypothetical protein